MLTKILIPKQYIIVAEKNSFQSSIKINYFTSKRHLFIKSNQQTSLNYNSQYGFWKFSSDQNSQQDRSTQHTQTNQELRKASNPDNNIQEMSFFNYFKKMQKNNEEQQKNVKNRNYFEQMKNSQLKFLFQEQVSKLKDVGKASYKYFLIGIFVLGFAYSIPKSISTFLATKMAISAQLSIENLKKENELLKSKLEYVKNKIEAQNLNQNEQKQDNKY
ncbi:unnamed protein product [Paramecium pentaurelia]|uniref:Transmembrane protein n=1 Tax=Paramecium pentaurelia TaxID=43138 RepID=A0A8S1YMU9_9CILI|nr:unnamed protein product [Paramecium pentaurelia]